MSSCSIYNEEYLDILNYLHSEGLRFSVPALKFELSRIGCTRHGAADSGIAIAQLEWLHAHGAELPRQFMSNTRFHYTPKAVAWARSKVT